MAPHAAPTSPPPPAANTLPLASGRLCAWAYTLGRVSLGLVFLVSGVLKSFSLHDFARIIGDYGLLPRELLFPAALLLIVCEMAGGLGLLFEARYSLGLINALLVAFIAVLAYARHLGLDVDCGCFGPSDPERLYHSGLLEAIWRDAALLGLSAWLIWYRRRHKVALRKPWPPFSREAS